MKHLGTASFRNEKEHKQVHYYVHVAPQDSLVARCASSAFRTPIPVWLPMAPSEVDLADTLLIIESGNLLARDAFELPHNKDFVIHRVEEAEEPSDSKDRDDTPCLVIPKTTCALRLSHKPIHPDLGSEPRMQSNGGDCSRRVDSPPPTFDPTSFPILGKEVADLPFLLKRFSGTIQQHGYVRLRASDHTPATLPSTITSGTFQQQSASAHRTLPDCYFIRTKEQEISKNNPHCISVNQPARDASNPTALFAEYPNNGEYIIIETGNDRATREHLGISQPILTCGDLASRTRIPGIHTPYLYISSEKGSFFRLHREDFDLPSANFLHAGAPKLWLIVHQDFLDACETTIGESLGLSPESHRCHQFFGHKNLLPTLILFQQNKTLETSCFSHLGSIIMV